MWRQLQILNAIVCLVSLTCSSLALAAMADATCVLTFTKEVANGLYSHEQIKDKLESLNLDPLILKLELNRLASLRDGNHKGSKNWVPFYPFWVFNEPATLEKILDYFDPHDADANPRFVHGVEAWVIQWEQLYLNHLGPLAKKWSDANFKGRRRFVQEILVQAAVRAADRYKLKGSNTFLGTDEHENLAVRELAAQIQNHFSGQPGIFQKRFDRLYRKITNSPIRKDPGVPTIELETRAKLRGVGEDPTKNQPTWNPRVKADARERLKSADIQRAVTAIRESAVDDFPLVSMLIESSGDTQNNVEAGLSWADLEMLSERHGGLREYLKSLNKELELQGMATVQPGPGANDLVQEMALQVGTYWVMRALGSSPLSDFQRFTKSDRESRWYINTSVFLFSDWHFKLDSLSIHVKRRLEAILGQQSYPAQ